MTLTRRQALAAIGGSAILTRALFGIGRSEVLERGIGGPVRVRVDKGIEGISDRHQDYRWPNALRQHNATGKEDSDCGREERDHQRSVLEADQAPA